MTMTAMVQRLTGAQWPTADGRRLRRRKGTVLLAAALIAVSGCGADADSPKGHDERMDKASGVSVFELVITSDLWEETMPGGINSDLGDVKGTSPGGKLADRGLKEYRLSGAQLVEYLDNIETCGYGGWMETSGCGANGTVLAKRVYDEIAPVLDEISGPRGPDEPAPRVVIDDTTVEGA
ncbi:hypothetical protein HNR25_005175 [Streptomonospora salina]|uniref:Uncharacterized protein n=1 Tax=Streptomonospora salina TaxID=104205 RepID=A0A841EGC0_9ACTN|nr:hypothetical protein [Streptomonospora salina]MBB6001344.1 hypothetical protein [Streptomonospora salina]